MRTMLVVGALALSLSGPLGVAALPGSEPAPQAEEARPIVQYRRRFVVPGREAEAWALAQRMNTYLAANYGDEYRPLVLSANGDQLHWFAELTNLVAFWNIRDRLAEDEGWQALVGGADELFEEEGRLDLRLFPIGGAGPNPRAIATRFLRITRAPYSKLPLSRSFAKRVVEYLEDTYEGLDARAYSADMDDPSAVFLMVDYYDWVTWDAIRLSLLEDEGYLELFEQADGLFLDAETEEVQLD